MNDFLIKRKKQIMKENASTHWTKYHIAKCLCFIVTRYEYCGTPITGLSEIEASKMDIDLSGLRILHELDIREKYPDIEA